MLLDLIDSLRCPVPHEESWLVLSADRWEDRHVVEGRLGCPVCHADYAIHDGVADFSAGESSGAEPEPGVRDPGSDPVDPDGLFRLAAQLDLREPGGVVLLAGSCAALAAPLAGLAPALYVTVNAGPGDVASSALGVGRRWPFATAGVRAVALDRRHALSDLLHDAGRILRPSGRLVAPADAPLPPEFTEVARDEREWVAVTRGPAGLVVPLRRSR